MLLMVVDRIWIVLVMLVVVVLLVCDEQICRVFTPSSFNKTMFRSNSRIRSSEMGSLIMPRWVKSFGW
jgi:hypothetical protein